MSVRPFPGHALPRALLIFFLPAAAGCGGFSLFDGGGSRPTLDLTTLGVGDQNTYFESGLNEEFETAEFTPVSDTGRVIRGSIESGGDVDVFDLGPVAVGDRVVVDMTSGGTLDAALALYDETGAAYLVNDHRNVYLGTRVPFIDVTVQHASNSCFVAVAATPGYAGTGAYALIASKVGPVALPPKRPDTVLLIFNGGRGVRIGGRPAIDVPAFDAASISPEFEGMSEWMVDEIVAMVRDDFEGFDVQVLSTVEGATFDSSFTRVYFGTFDEALLGVAEGVDEFNRTYGQVAIVFTDTFAAFSRLNPTVEQMAQAIANVASHEFGHLLGLVHTHDPDGIMDVTASLKRLMQDQALKRAPIYAGVFPLGEQDAIGYLLDAVGGLEAVVTAKNLNRQLRAPIVADDDDGVPARASLRLGTCGLDHQ